LALSVSASSAVIYHVSLWCHIVHDLAKMPMRVQHIASKR
jgi:hypothetical protein